MLIPILFISDHTEASKPFILVPRKRREATPLQPFTVIPVLPCELTRITHMYRDRLIHYHAKALSMQ